MRHYLENHIPNTLLPDASEEDVQEAKKKLVELARHIELLDVQAWMLSFAQVWERDLKEWGLDKFSMGFDRDALGSKMVVADLWIAGKKWCFENPFQLYDEQSNPMQGKNAVRWYDLIKQEMVASPSNPMLRVAGVR